MDTENEKQPENAGHRIIRAFHLTRVALLLLAAALIALAYLLS